MEVYGAICNRFRLFYIKTERFFEGGLVFGLPQCIERIEVILINSVCIEAAPTDTVKREMIACTIVMIVRMRSLENKTMLCIRIMGRLPHHICQVSKCRVQSVLGTPAAELRAYTTVSAFTRLFSPGV